MLHSSIFVLYFMIEIIGEYLLDLTPLHTFRYIRELKSD